VPQNGVRFHGLSSTIALFASTKRDPLLVKWR
jgi:hypothetical protein